MINKPAIKELVKQLREHNNNQIRDQLFGVIGGENCYCVEGIMAKVYCEMNNIPYSIDFDNDNIIVDGNKNYMFGIVTQEIDEYFSSKLLYIRDGVSMIMANDNLKLSFDQIADELEEKYLTRRIMYV